MKIRSNYRSDETLVLNFDFPVGIGSCGFTEAEFMYHMKQYNKDVKLEQSILENITEMIDDIIVEVLGAYVEIDWRDDKTLEIHSIGQKFEKDKTEELIKTIKNSIKSMIKN